MASTRYTPVITRLKAFFQHVLSEFQEARCTNPLLIALSRKINRDPTVLLSGTLFLLAIILLLNPEGIAPYLANILALVPALQTLRHLAAPHSAAKVQRGRFLLDYWTCLCSSIVVEQLIGAEVVGGLIPVWWLTKGLAGVLVAVSLGGEVGTQQYVSSESRRGLRIAISPIKHSASALPEPEPSPSPVANVLSALIAGFEPAVSSLASATSTPLDSVTFMRDNVAPHRIISPSSTEHTRPELKLSLDELRSRQQRSTSISREATGAQQPMTPREQLDAFLDSTAASPIKPRPEDAKAAGDAKSSVARLVGGISAEHASGEGEEEEEVENDEESSPAFLLDPNIHPTDMALEDLISPAKPTGDAAASPASTASARWKQDMSLDELLTLEKKK